MKQRGTTLIQIIIESVLIIVYFVLFYRQAIQYRGGYWSDLPDHISFALSGESYSLLYRLLWLFMQMPFSYHLIALFEAVLVAVTWWVLRDFLLYHVKMEDYYAMPAAFLLMMLTSIYIPRVQPFFYISSLVAQPWHNITYIVMRPLAIRSFHHFLCWQDTMGGPASSRGWTLTTIYLLVATMIKPNYLLAFSWTLLLFLIYWFVTKKYHLRRLFLTGMTVIPSCIVLAIQGVILYGENAYEGGSVVFTLKNELFWGDHSLHAAKYLFFGLIFPAVVFVHNRKKIHMAELFVILMYVVALFQAAFLVESGVRHNDYNFYGGLKIAAVFLFAYAIGFFVGDIKKIKPEGKWSVYHVVAGAALFLQSVSGLVYLVTVFFSMKRG